MEPQRNSSSQNQLEKDEQSWRDVIVKTVGIDMKTLIDQRKEARIQKQTHTLMVN